jgi:hypothetical protein
MEEKDGPYFCSKLRLSKGEEWSKKAKWVKRIVAAPTPSVEFLARLPFGRLKEARHIFWLYCLTFKSPFLIFDSPLIQDDWAMDFGTGHNFFYKRKSSLPRIARNL